MTKSSNCSVTNVDGWWWHTAIKRTVHNNFLVVEISNLLYCELERF